MNAHFKGGTRKTKPFGFNVYSRPTFSVIKNVACQIMLLDFQRQFIVVFVKPAYLYIFKSNNESKYIQNCVTHSYQAAYKVPVTRKRIPQLQQLPTHIQNNV